MHPRLRYWLILAFGATAGMIVSYDIAQESYLSAVLITGLIGWLVLEWLDGPFPESWLLAVTLVGYILGNRGFAQLQLAPSLPLFPAEAVLLVTVPALLFRLAQKRAQAFWRDPLNYAVVIWAILGAAPLPADFSRHGFLAARDFAMVYYVAFFFLGQAFARHAPSQRLLRRALTAACLTLPVLATAFHYLPDFFLNTLTMRGVPLIFYKDDLLATLFAAAFFWLWTRWELHQRRRWLLPAAACLLMISTTASPRAAMVAVAGVTVLWLAARRWQLAATQAVVIGLAAIGALFFFSLINRDFRQTSAYATYENIVSIFDYQATGNYGHRESGDPGDNNRFRLVWWRAVVDETLEESPVFGLGFGHDLAARFLANYGLLGAGDFSARSPHSMPISVFGRMGAAGLIGWIAIAAGIAGMTRRIFRRGTPDSRGFASIVWVIWISACFGVVLEGPMGAVVFWTALGLANGTPPETNDAETAREIAAQSSAVLPPKPEPATFRVLPVFGTISSKTPPPRS